jgi:uncharacterized protein
MPRKYIKPYLPSADQVKNNKYLKIFGKLLHEPNLWHLNKKTVAGGITVGLFCAWVPIPFQMVLAAGLAILFRVNISLSIAGVWVSNPLTMPPMFYGAYTLGAWLLDIPETAFSFEPSWEWLGTGLVHIWQPFLFGCFVMAIFSCILGFVGAKLLWRLAVVKQWNGRKRKKLSKPNI